jgi:hypothetical protein
MLSGQSTVDRDLPVSLHHVYTWLSCAAHGITPEGDQIYDLVVIAPGKTRDIHPPQKEEWGYLRTQVVETEVAFARNPLTFLGECTHRLAKEGVMNTYRFADRTVVCERGMLKRSEDAFASERVIACADPKIWSDARSLWKESSDGFRKAFRKWTLSYSYTLQHAEQIWEMFWEREWKFGRAQNPDYVRVCCETIRWIHSQSFSPKLYLIMTTLPAPEMDKVEVFNSVLKSFWLRPISEEYLSEHRLMIDLAIKIFDRIGDPFHHLGPFNGKYPY